LSSIDKIANKKENMNSIDDYQRNFQFFSKFPSNLNNKGSAISHNHTGSTGDKSSDSQDVTSVDKQQVGRHSNELNPTQLSLMNTLKLKLSKLKEQKVETDLKFNK
jgi:hypothetical protein